MKWIYGTTRFPVAYDFSPRVRAAMERASVKAAALDPTDMSVWRELAMLATHPSTPDAYAQVVTDEFELLRKQLEHELCGELWARFGVTEYQASRSEQEQACCLQTRSMIRAALRDSSSRADDWIEVLCRVASSVNGRDMRIRTVPVFAVSKQVDYWEFPPFDVVEPQLRRLHGALVSKRSSPFFQAMLSLVGITFLHPFLDGNGRTSRIVFNALIDTDEAYIPLKEIQYLSKGGFTLKLKQAWLHGNWNPVVEFFCSSIDMAELMSKGRALRGSIDGGGAFFSALGYGGGKCQPGVTR